MKKITLLMLIVFTTISSQAQNKLLSSIGEYYDGTTWYTTTATNYEYDANNNLIVETLYVYDFPSSSWKTSSKTTYTYNANNKLLQEIGQNWNETTSALENDYRDTYTYSSGNITGQVAEIWVSSNWVNEWKNEVSYNSNTLPETALFYNWDGAQWVVDSREVITYNANNRLDTDISQNWVSLLWANNYKTVFTYNINNKITIKRGANWDDFNNQWGLQDSRVDYVLDLTGNRTTETNTSTNAADNSKNEYTYDTSSLMTAFANPFRDKTGIDYFSEDFPYVNKVLGYNQFSYNTATSSYVINRRTTYNYNNSFVLANEKFEIANPSVTIFPNPTSYFLNIQTSLNTEIDQVIVTDLSGKIILQQNQTNQVNVQNLAKGMYLLQVFSGDQKWQSKFLKE